MKKPIKLAVFFACPLLYLLATPAALAATVQVTFTQSILATTTTQPPGTATFDQVSPTPTSYTLNTQFKAFFSGVTLADPTLGTATGQLFEIPGSGCDAANYASFPSGGIALLGSPTGCTPGTYSAQIAAATAAGAAGTITRASLADVTFLNLGLTDPTSIPTIFVSSTVGDALLAILNDTPLPTTYTVGGSISGLTGSVTLQNNGADDLVRSANGAFTFATALADSSTYNVTVLSQPSGQTCTVTSGSGTISAANVTDVAVNCVDNPSAPPAPAGGATPIPTMSSYALALTILGLLLVAGRRLRLSIRRR